MVNCEDYGEVGGYMLEDYFGILIHRVLNFNSDDLYLLIKY